MSLSVKGYFRVSLGFRPRPSLSGHLAQRAAPPSSSVAGVSAPAFVERFLAMVTSFPFASGVARVSALAFRLAL